MSAIAEAEQMFRQHYPDRLFVEQLGLYLRHGFVLSFPDLFAMGRPVMVRAPISAINDPSVHFAHVDGWYIDMAVGRLPDLARALPYRLLWICFYRKFGNTLKVYPTSKFLWRCAT